MYGHVDPGERGGLPNFPDLILSFVKTLECDTFLELGVAHGFTSRIIKPHVKRWIGVDCRDIREKEKFDEFHLCTSDDFFKYFKDPVEVGFIDADHSLESVKRDLNNLLKILVKNGLIFIHDTDPWDALHMQDWLCSDSYKIIDYIQNERSDLNVLTVPVNDAGLSIVNRRCDRRVLEFLPKNN